MKSSIVGPTENVTNGKDQERERWRRSVRVRKETNNYKGLEMQNVNTLVFTKWINLKHRKFFKNMASFLILPVCCTARRGKGREAPALRSGY